ncbi:MAG TPA: TetR/AcrR family transcriptional regulator [Actinocrinis sp.]|nr:TetR/AcrR family transcriptional regulator [Actinocrinis sp.]
MPTRAARGRPRSERAKVAVLDAASELLVTGGIDAVTMEAIAARSKVSKATLYKWWPSRAHVMLESLFARTEHTIVVDEGTPLAQALTEKLLGITELFRDTEVGPLIADLVAASQADADIRAALDQHWLRPRRQVTAGLLRAAIDRGELEPDTDIPVAVDQLYAPVYYRLLMRHEPLNDELAATLVRQMLGGLRARPKVEAVVEVGARADS